ncbi:MAG: DUF6036 family nucleotidyltransferase [Pyrinomonadaceae bacterium]
MRSLTDRDKISRFMHALGSRVSLSARVYLTGGSSAVLHGWRLTTLDIDLKFIPDLDEIFRQLPKLKEELEMNIELAAPSDFIPELPGWEERSIYIGSEGKIRFYHYDPYSQALSKIERGHTQDVADVESMFRDKLIDVEQLLRHFKEIESRLYRYPAINPDKFAANVRAVIERFE